MLTLKIGVWDVYSQEALLKLIERSEIVQGWYTHENVNLARYTQRLLSMEDMRT